MCDQCECWALLWHNPVVPGFYLIKAQKDGWYIKKDWYGLVDCNDPDFVFSIVPEKDPLYSMSAQEKEAMGEKNFSQLVDAWEDKYLEFEAQMTIDPRCCRAGHNADGTPREPQHRGVDLIVSHKLYQACVDAGWNPEDMEKKPHSHIYAWLFHRIACHLEAETLIEDVGYTNKEKEKNPIALERDPRLEENVSTK